MRGYKDCTASTGNDISLNFGKSLNSFLRQSFGRPYINSDFWGCDVVRGRVFWEKMLVSSTRAFTVMSLRPCIELWKTLASWWLFLQKNLPSTILKMVGAYFLDLQQSYKYFRAINFLWYQRTADALLNVKSFCELIKLSVTKIFLSQSISKNHNAILTVPDLHPNSTPLV